MTTPATEELVCRIRRDSDVFVALDVFDEGGATYAVEGDVPAVGSYVRARSEGQTVRVLETLAEADTARAEVFAIAVTHGLDPRFPAAVMAEVAALVTVPGLDDASLEDRRSLPLVTIDDASSRDLDQALAVERSAQGFVVWYALADAAHFVRPGSALYAEALRRGASFYLPDLMIPMLPRLLSEGIVSLNPDVERRAMLFRIALDAEGQVTDTRIERARIRSRAKLSFESVQCFLNGDDDGTIADVDSKDGAIADSLHALHDVGRLRVADAEERDVVHYRRQEVKTHLGEGLRFILGASLRLQVERDNEQISLLCNIEGARALGRGDTPKDDVQPIYRVHAAPPRQKVERLETFLTALAQVHGLDAGKWTWRPGGEESLSAFLERLPTEGAQGRIAKAIHRQAVMINGRSVFREQPGPHYGIGAELYARFSAPMREMVGVFVHQELWERLGAEVAPLPAGVRSVDALADQIVARANEAKMMQKRITRDANRLVLDQLLGDSQTQGARLTGTLVGLTPTKAHVLLDAPPIDLKVYVKDARAGLRVDEAQAVLLDSQGQRRAAVGDAVTLEVLGRDERRDRWRLDIHGEVSA